MVKLEDYERTTRPELVGRLRSSGGFCWVVTGSTQYGRAYADPKDVPDAIALLRRAQARRANVVFRVQPVRRRTSVPFSFDYSFNYYPLTYDRPGPEIVIYRLRCDTAPHEARRRVLAGSSAVARLVGAPNLIVWLGGRAPVTHGPREGPARPRPRSCLGAQVDAQRRAELDARRTASTPPRELYKAGRVDKLLLSGDHSRVRLRRGRHDAADPARARASRPQDIFTDHAGFDTWDSRAAGPARLRRRSRPSSSPSASTWPARSTTPAAPG